jgi:TfuA protein
VKSVVFVGPSLSRDRLRELTSADIRDPIRRGDLAGCDDYDTIVILDGEFGQSLSVSPKEILAALKRGKTVIGASSMGALRASELNIYGMVGIGWVYERFASAAVRLDDDVALRYSPLDFAAMTVPMVDIEYWLETLTAQGLVTKPEAAKAVRAARKIFFADRTVELTSAVLAECFGHARLARLLAASNGAIPEIKRFDAERAIHYAQLAGSSATTR